MMELGGNANDDYPVHSRSAIWRFQNVPIWEMLRPTVWKVVVKVMDASGLSKLSESVQLSSQLQLSVGASVDGTPCLLALMLSS